MSFDRSHECCLFTAYESAGAESDVEIEIEACAEYVFAEQSVFSGLVYRDRKSFNGDRIFSSDIDVTLVRSDGISGDSHRFDN